jgi:histidyl-tRNA synthetase
MAALIAETLSLDLTMPIIKGLDVEYISQSMVYLKAEVSAEILLKLENFKIQKILDRILKLNPLKVLDILHHIPETKKKYVSVSLSVDQFQNIHLSETRKKILNEWSTKTF